VGTALPGLVVRGVQRRDARALAGAVALLASLLLSALAFVAGAATADDLRRGEG
jgi:hypothetical protein